MFDELQFFDIIFFALIAVFVIWRLRRALGRRTGQERQRPSGIFSRSTEPDEKNSGKVIHLPGHGDESEDKLFEKELSDIDQHQLGYMYLRGRGVARDDIQAHMWWSLAASQGYKASTIARTLVAGRMAPAQIAEAEKLAREWKPK